MKPITFALAASATLAMTGSVAADQDADVLTNNTMAMINSAYATDFEVKASNTDALTSERQAMIFAAYDEVLEDVDKKVILARR